MSYLSKRTEDAKITAIKHIEARLQDQDIPSEDVKNLCIALAYIDRDFNTFKVEEQNNGD